MTVVEENLIDSHCLSSKGLRSESLAKRKLTHVTIKMITTRYLTHGVTYGQILATLSATSGEYAATVLGGHTSAETMLVETAMVVWLECHLHNCNAFLLYYFYCIVAAYCGVIAN